MVNKSTGIQYEDRENKGLFLWNRFKCSHYTFLAYTVEFK